MSKHIHILGICGTFMGSLAQLAKASGFKVTGSDQSVYPPMSTQLSAAGIELIEGFSLEQLTPRPDLVVVGNVISRGNPVMEAILNLGIPYVSGPQWLNDNILKGKWVLGVSGTHGKTTTSSMLAWILDYAGMAPGYLIGGVPQNFDVSARLGSSDFFVIEADEYDTAFFDKRSKFVHYGARTLIVNNLEFDHADIFPDLGAIQRQFHHMIRTVPSDGLVICPQGVIAIEEMLEMGCWTPVQRTAMATNMSVGAVVSTHLPSQWQVELMSDDGGEFDILFEGNNIGRVEWELSGIHNVFNGLHALVAARHVGVDPSLSVEALTHFSGVKRRMELRADIHGVRVYDDFAHHPTAISSTLEGLRKRVGNERIIALIEPRSNTMQKGVHRSSLLASVALADFVVWREPADLSWDLKAAVSRDDSSSQVCSSVEAILAVVPDLLVENTHVVIMSNGGFEDIHTRLIECL